MITISWHKANVKQKFILVYNLYDVVTGKQQIDIKGNQPSTIN